MLYRQYSFGVLLFLALYLFSPMVWSSDLSRFTVIAIDSTQHKLDLYLYNEQKRPFKRFNHLATWLQLRCSRIMRLLGLIHYYPPYFSLD